jgi:hypothetical protein
MRRLRHQTSIRVSNGEVELLSECEDVFWSHGPDFPKNRKGLQRASLDYPKHDGHTPLALVTQLPKRDARRAAPAWVNVRYRRSRLRWPSFHGTDHFSATATTRPSGDFGHIPKSVFSSASAVSKLARSPSGMDCDSLIESNDLNYTIDLTHVHMNQTALLVDFERCRDARSGRDAVARSRSTTFNVKSSCALVVTRWLGTPVYTSDPNIDALVSAVPRNVVKHRRNLGGLAKSFCEVSNLAREAGPLIVESVAPKARNR